MKKGDAIESFLQYQNKKTDAAWYIIELFCYLKKKKVSQLDYVHHCMYTIIVNSITLN